MRRRWPKTVAILNATGDKILSMKAEEGHAARTPRNAAQWSMTGGRSLIRMGCHWRQRFVSSVRKHAPAANLSA